MEQPSAEEVRAVVADLLHEIIEVPLTVIEPGSRLVEDLAVDSLSLVELLTGIEEQLGVRIADADVARLVTVEDAVLLIAAAV